MQLTISPSDFARIMALPSGLRQDLLEFLGSTPVAAGEVDRMLRTLGARATAHGAATESEAA